MSSPSVSEDDEGKPVVTSDGSRVGLIADVRGETAYVNPDPRMLESVRSRLGWEQAEGDDAERDTYPLTASDVSAVTDDEVRLE